MCVCVCVCVCGAKLIPCPLQWGSVTDSAAYKQDRTGVCVCVCVCKDLGGGVSKMRFVHHVWKHGRFFFKLLPKHTHSHDTAANTRQWGASGWTVR